jgi:hypothetical protein
MLPPDVRLMPCERSADIVFVHNRKCQQERTYTLSCCRDAHPLTRLAPQEPQLIRHMARHRHVVTGTNPRQEALAQPAKTPRQAVSRTLQHPDNIDDAPRKLFALMKAWEAQHLNAHKGDCFRQEASDRCQGFSDHLPPGCTTAAQ